MSTDKDYTEALARHRAGVDSVDDLLVLAAAESMAACEVLPPIADAPRANTLGAVVVADPMHASACALRAYAFIQQARRRMLTEPSELPSDERVKP